MADEQPRHGILPALAALAVPIDSLMANPVNTRRHEAKSLDALKVSLAKYGQRKPIVVQAHGRIVRAGNGMLAAAKQLGWTHIAAVIVDETNVDAVAYEIMDNKSAELSSWEDEALALQLASLREDDIDLALTGFTGDELDELLGDLTGKTTTEDTPPEPPPVAVSRRGDLWLCGRHRVLCGDSTSAEDVARLMAGEKAKLYNTDPPYGVDYTATKNGIPRKGFEHIAEDWGDIQQDDVDGAHLQAFLESVFRAVLPHLDRAAWYLWHAHLTQGFFAAAAAAAADVLLHRQIIWRKPGFVLTRSGMYHWQHEPCFYGWVRGQQCAWLGNKSQSSVWELDRERDTVHPTQKPVELFAIPIRNHLHKDEVCVDTFLGSGSQLVAAEQLDVRCFGLEIEPRYIDAAITRWANLTNSEPTLDGDGRTFSEIAEERGVKTPSAMAEVRA